MTDDNDNFDDETPFEKAIEGVENYDEQEDLDPHLKRALRQLTLGIDEVKTVMRKRGLFPFGKH